jgi:hypothetical protein
MVRMILMMRMFLMNDEAASANGARWQRLPGTVAGATGTARHGGRGDEPLRAQLFDPLGEQFHEGRGNRTACRLLVQQVMGDAVPLALLERKWL